ncbi:MAG: PleD family two-component system response regulator [Anaerolineae bacterium]
MTILIIDDDASMRTVFSDVVEALGFEAASAPDGMRGLAAVRDLKPQAILLDINKPEKDGFEVLERLRAEPELAEIPVIIISASIDLGQLDEIPGISGVLIKGRLDFNEVRIALRNAGVDPHPRNGLA